MFVRKIGSDMFFKNRHVIKHFALLRRDQKINDSFDLPATGFPPGAAINDIHRAHQFTLATFFLDFTNSIKNAKTEKNGEAIRAIRNSC